MGISLGIDLGTTNSVGAFKQAVVEIVTADSNKPEERTLTPSVVCWDGDHFIVGEAAYNQLLANPESVIKSIKRLIGRGFNESTVQDNLASFPYKVTKPTEGTENSISVWLKDREYSPEDISAEILKEVVKNAETYLAKKNEGQKDTITYVVVTVPAYFNDKQNHATQQAIYKADLKPLELLPEPTAAAISYGFKPDSDDVQTILVYDFGGGTFDSCLITAVGNQFIESGKAADLWLGGDDIDSQIVDLVKKEVTQEWDLNDVDALIEKMPHSQSCRLKADLKKCVEEAKISLSSKNSVSITPSSSLIDDAGLAVPIDVEITREQFEQMIEPIVERTINISMDALKISKYTKDMIDVVLMVGGSSQIPLVQRKVRQEFGEDKVVVHPRPMYAVAEGAAIVAAGGIDKVGTVSRDYFIDLVGNQKYKLISQGDILPFEKDHTFKTNFDGQRFVHIIIYCLDHESEGQNYECVGDMWLTLDQPYPCETEISVTTELDDKNNPLRITASLKNNPSITVSASFSRGEKQELKYKIVQEKKEEFDLIKRALTEEEQKKGEEVFGKIFDKIQKQEDR